MYMYNMCMYIHVHVHAHSVNCTCMHMQLYPLPWQPSLWPGSFCSRPDSSSLSSGEKEEDICTSYNVGMKSEYMNVGEWRDADRETITMYILYN